MIVIRDTLVVPFKQAEYIEKLLSMTSKECYDKFGLKADETIVETIRFPDINYEVDIKLVIPFGDNEKPWTESILFHNGLEVCCSDVEDVFFGNWQFIINDYIFDVSIEKELENQ